MNINEDRFSNKSAEEIISDMLTQHKNNSKEALEHIQDILNDDGLTLSKDVKDNLQKAATMLSDKGLKEGWFSKPLPKESVVFEVYLPFKKEPAQFQIPPVSSLDDPLVTETIQKIRKRHPHSTIYIRSKLGNKTIREKKEEPSLFSKMVKGVLNSDITKNLTAVGLAGLTGISPVFTKPAGDAALKATSEKLESTSGYKVNLYNESGVYSCTAGNLPIALTLVENAKQYTKADVLFEGKVICSYNHALKEWTTSKSENTLKEDIYTNDDITNHAYVDFRKDIADIDERTKLILCHLNPNLIDKRKPKWHNTLLDTPKMSPIENSILGTKGEVLIVLEGIDNEVNKKNPDQTEVTIREKIPYSQKGNSYLYKDGDSYVITVAQFKDILNDPENAETLEKFEDSKEAAILNDDLASYFLELDKLAKQSIDARYPEWEANHMEDYKLDMYNLPERAKIYQAWKDLNRTNMYQQARELTPEEVDRQFGLPKLKKILNTQRAGKKIMTAFDSVKKMLPKEEQVKLDEELLDLLTDTNTVEDTDIAQIIGYYGAKNQLNQISKDSLNKIASGLSPEDKEKFDTELKTLINDKYVDHSNGLPTVAKQVKDAMNDINTLIKKYLSLTQSSRWNNEVNSSKQIIDVVNAIKSEINTLNPDHQKIANRLMSKLRGNVKKWQANNITGDALVKELENFLTQTKNWINNFNSGKYDTETEPKFDNEIKHEDWINMVKHIKNPNSKSETDPSYYGAITNKISRLIKHDPQAAKGYGNAFRNLLKNLEAKELSEKEIEVQLAKFLDTMKDETGGFGTVTKALASAI